MTHAREADAYDYLATSKVSELTVAQLEQALENSFLNKSNIEFWKGPITMHRLLEVSRTYPWGLPIPEESAIFQETVGAGEIITIRPPGTEIWEVRAMRGTGIPGACTTTVTYQDGVYSQELRVSDAISATGTNYDLNSQTDGPFYLTNSLWLTITETGASNGLMILMSYHKVSL